MKRTLLLVSGLVLALTSLGVGCGSSSNSTSSDAGMNNDSGTGGDGSVAMDAGGNDGGAACNSFAIGGQQVDVQQVASDPPAAMGGTIMSGTYVMTSAKIYTGVGGATGPSGETTQQTIVISTTNGTSGTVQIAQISFGGDSPTIDRSTGTFNVSGTNLTYADTCGGTDSGTAGFTVAGNTFTIYPPGNAGTTREEVFTRQ